MEVLHRKLVSEADIGLASVYNCTSTICDEYCASCVYDSSPPAPSPVADESAHNNHAVPYLVSAACVLGIAFLILTTCTIILRHRWSRRRSSRSVVATSQDSEEDFDPVDHPIWHIVTVGLPQSVIDSITAVSYKTCDGFIDGSDCSVCLTQFEDGDEVRVLPKCSHAFHLPCIDTWLRSHKNCPLCRAPVVNDSSPVTLNRNSSNPDSSRSDGIQNPENPREIAHGDNDDDFYALPVEAAGTAERVLSYVGENLRVDRESFEPVRSVSFDSPAASAVNKSVVIDVGILNSGEGSSEQEKIVEVEEAEKEGNQDSGISRLMKSSSIGLSLQMSPVARILSPFRGSKSQSSSTLP